MSETNGTTAEATKPKKEAPPQIVVKMEDGRDVTFVGKRRMLKDYTINEADGTITTVFDFVNGATRKFELTTANKLYPRFAAHGVLQKFGDETAGDEGVEDMVLHVEAIMERCGNEEWGAERAAGDGFSGAGVVVKAIMEASGKDLAFVKAFLEKKLADDKAAGGTLTRQKLYQSFRAPGSKTAPIIARLEAEKAQKDVAVDADAELAAMMG